jgi:alpha-tubulin suppressor-like RCC1 family protein
VVDFDGGHSHSIAATLDGSLYTWGYGAATGQRLTTGQHLAPRCLVPTLVRWGGGEAEGREGKMENEGMAGKRGVEGEGGEEGKGGTEIRGRGDGPGASDIIGVGGGAMKEKERLQGRGRIIRVAAGKNHSMAITEQGVVLAWGTNDAGQLGHSRWSSAAMLSVPRAIPVSSWAGGVVVDMACGASHSLVAVEDGRVFAFGAGGDVDRVVPGFLEGSVADVDGRLGLGPWVESARRPTLVESPAKPSVCRTVSLS